MRYTVDHDLHIHTRISPCSSDERQTSNALLSYGLTNGFSLIGVSDHFWDLSVDWQDSPGWLDVGNEKWLSVLPLPQSKNCRFLFGAEVDMNRRDTVGISSDALAKTDYCLISVGHLHLAGFVTDPADMPRTPEFVHRYYLHRLNVLLAREDLPFERLGLTHFTSCLIENDRLAETLALFTDDELTDLFGRVARRGMGVELNAESLPADPALREVVLRPFRIAREQGCGFYLGGDAHHPENFAHTRRQFEAWVDLLDLTEDNKWTFVRQYVSRYVSRDGSL